jgi:hypothetical protein
MALAEQADELADTDGRIHIHLAGSGRLDG